MRIVFMGSPAFALPTLERLISLGKKPIAVYCQPDKPAGRGMKLTAPPTKDFALKQGIRVEQPAKLDGEALATFRGFQADLAIVIAYGKILKKEFLEAPRFGCVNLHASLLPHLRGAAPIQWTLLRGDQATGITLQKITEALDAGPVLAKKSVPVARMDFGALYKHLSEVAADTTEEFLQSWDGKSALTGTPQDESAVTYASKILPEMRMIDWNRPAETVMNHIRAFSPEPAARTLTADGASFQILQVSIARGKKFAPGTIHVSENRVFVGTQSDALEVLHLKAPGGRAMPTQDYLRGKQMPLAFHAKPQ